MEKAVHWCNRTETFFCDFTLNFCCIKKIWTVIRTYLEHLLDVVVFGFEQLTPGGQVAVGEDTAGLQHPVSVTLQTNTDTTTNQSVLYSCWDMIKRKQTTVSALNEAQCITGASILTLKSLTLFIDACFVLSLSILIHISCKQCQAFSDYPQEC